MIVVLEGNIKLDFSFVLGQVGQIDLLEDLSNGSCVLFGLLSHVSYETLSTSKSRSHLRQFAKF